METTEPIWASARTPILDSDWASDGNAFWLLGRAKQAQIRAGWTPEQTDAWFAEATSADYDHLVQTILRWHDETED